MANFKNAKLRVTMLAPQAYPTKKAAREAAFRIIP